MSANGTESRSAVAQAAGMLQTLVEANLGSIQAAVTARLTQLPARNERIQIDLGAGAGFVVDLAAGKVSNQLKALQTRLDDQAAAERAVGIEYLEGGRAAGKDRRGHRGDEEVDKASTETVAPNQRVWLLHNKGDEFLDLLDNPIISELIPDYLDEDYPMAAQFSANIVGGGSEAQFLHQDQHPVQPATPFAIGVNTLFCLDNFTEANGATRLIPGSHILERGLTPDNIYSTKGTVPAEAPAGSAILVDTRVWHGSGANTCSDPRRAIILLTQRSWARSVNNGVLSVHPSVLAKMSDRAKAMFGHRVTSGLGSIQTEPEGTMVGWNPDQLILEMRAEPSSD
jgi:ectoine hydroxylase-related dioxygenase (phytanoyl-CoA dioxygenase family)